MHDAAPVAGEKARRQEDGDVTCLGGFKCLRTPCVPLDGVRCVREEVGRGGVAERGGGRLGWERGRGFRVGGDVSLFRRDRGRGRHEATCWEHAGEGRGNGELGGVQAWASQSVRWGKKGHCG